MPRLCSFFALCLLLPFPSFAAPGDPSATPLKRMPRVRPDDPRVAAMLTDGLQRSPTLRALATRVEASDVIVYIELQPQLRGRLAGSLTWVTTAGGYRYLRVSLNPEMSATRLIEALAHELHHAVEVASNPSVVSAETLSALYRRIGVRTDSRREEWETIEAQNAGSRVRRELFTEATNVVAEAIHASRPTASVK